MTHEESVIGGYTGMRMQFPKFLSQPASFVPISSSFVALNWTIVMSLSHSKLANEVTFLSKWRLR